MNVVRCECGLTYVPAAEGEACPACGGRRITAARALSWGEERGGLYAAADRVRELAAERAPLSGSGRSAAPGCTGASVQSRPAASAARLADPEVVTEAPYAEAEVRDADDFGQARPTRTMVRGRWWRPQAPRMCNQRGCGKRFWQSHPASRYCPVCRALPANARKPIRPVGGSLRHGKRKAVA